MLNAVLQFMSSPALPVCVLGCGIVVVVVEAIRISPRALWADLFSDDYDA